MIGLEHTLLGQHFTDSTHNAVGACLPYLESVRLAGIKRTRFLQLLWQCLKRLKLFQWQHGKQAVRTQFGLREISRASAPQHLCTCEILFHSRADVEVS